MAEAALTPRAEQTRAAIIEAALSLFREAGYEATTMRAIARRAATHPPDRVHRREERLRGQVLGHRPLPAPGQQVAVDLGQRPVVEVEEGPRGVLPRQPLTAHTLIVVRAA